MDLLLKLLENTGLIEIVITLLSVVLYRVLDGRIAQDTLHKALTTGVDHMAEMLADGKITRDELIGIAVDYARRSSPGAIRKLKAPDSVLRDIAKAKLNRLRLGNAPDRPSPTFD